MELLLIRHAEPVEEHTPDGSPADPALTERGRAQSEALARWLAREGLDVLVSSPARRAQETAAAVALLLGKDVEIESRVRDANADADSYVPLEADRKDDRAGYHARLASYRESPRLTSIAERVNEALDDWTTRLRGGRLAVFCHGSVINVFAARVLGLGNAAFLESDYASAHRFLISRKGIRSVKSLNETAYLLSD